MGGTSIVRETFEVVRSPAIPWVSQNPASEGQGGRFLIKVKAPAMTSSPARFLDNFTTESFGRIELTFADGHLNIKSRMDREERPVGP